MHVGPFYGNEKDGSSSWPRNTVLTPGDRVTICFSAKTPPKSRDGGGRDHHRWGFKCVARGIIIRPIPWLLDLESTVTAACSRYIHTLIAGETIAPSELALRTIT